MSSQQNGHSQDDLKDVDFAKAFQELSRGEQTATQLENHLTALEAKIEELLAAANQQEQPSAATAPASNDNNNNNAQSNP